MYKNASLFIKFYQNSSDSSTTWQNYTEPIKILLKFQNLVSPKVLTVTNGLLTICQSILDKCFNTPKHSINVTASSTILRHERSLFIYIHVHIKTRCPIWKQEVVPIWPYRAHALHAFTLWGSSIYANVSAPRSTTAKYIMLECTPQRHQYI